MPEYLVNFITNYGYLAVFLLVLAQELGVPNPVPTELIIIFAGYLTSIGVLGLRQTFLAAILGDLVGTTTLCLIFYTFGEAIMKKKPKWLPVKWDKVERAKKMISERGRWVVFVWRLIPYIRGYASVAAGFLNMPLREFVPMAALSALIASGGYVLLGHFLGSKWNTVTNFIGSPVYVGVAVVLIIGLLLIIRQIFQRRRQ
jgi:membrane protein DedA with SNARE-associated domain